MGDSASLQDYANRRTPGEIAANCAAAFMTGVWSTAPKRTERLSFQIFIDQGENEVVHRTKFYVSGKRHGGMVAQGLASYFEGKTTEEDMVAVAQETGRRMGRGISEAYAKAALESSGT